MLTKKTRGPSCLIYFGKQHRGGEPWVGCGGGPSKHRLAADVIGTRYKKGQLVRGEAHDARKAPLFVDGNLLQFTRSFQGGDSYAADIDPKLFRSIQTASPSLLLLIPALCLQRWFGSAPASASCQWDCGTASFTLLDIEITDFVQGFLDGGGVVSACLLLWIVAGALPCSSQFEPARCQGYKKKVSAHGKRTHT
jgi:hypothetical protein